ncbi:hypothetical protein Y032_0038g3656 [Ancylostoma ceylanicum]|uniref:Uncharacterized protein n=1 Tax=Ancylostoma ceylanicum TaxID=53326 RepID=A0A016UIZ9_9BILA|nr:hypothetical protein Y032_0038g3656 [Ancylostoma ceylanicum]
MVSEVNADSDEDMDEDNRKPGLVAISSDEDEAREEEDVFSKIRRSEVQFPVLSKFLRVQVCLAIQKARFVWRYERRGLLDGTLVLIRDVTLCCAVCHRCYLPRLP